MPYININLLNLTVEQVRDSLVEAEDAAGGDACLLTWPVYVGYGILPGDKVGLTFNALD